MNDGKEATSLAPGTMLHGAANSYTITDVLGQGTFGITYKAVMKSGNTPDDGEADTFVAVKEFFMHDINGRTGTTVTSGSTSKDGMFAYYSKKFEHEARNLSTLHHTNIVHVIELFHANGTVYYSMELIDGHSLDTTIALAPQGRLTQEQAADYTRQIGAALSFMHSRKMLHLDVKPSNVMVGADGKAVLIDFGLSKQYDDDGNPESSTTVGRGTPGYAPLEQANYREGKAFPVTMDVYALGATTFKMLTGHTPPEASELLNNGFPMSELRSLGVHDDIASCVRQAMAPLIKDRYKTVDQYTLALSGGLHEDTEVDFPDDDEQEDDGRKRKWIIGICCAMVIATAGLFYTNNSNKTTETAAQQEQTDSAASTTATSAEPTGNADKPETAVDGSNGDTSAEPQKPTKTPDSPSGTSAGPQTPEKPTTPAKTEAEEKPKQADTGKVYDVAEQMPSFPGGNAALMNYLASNIHYPTTARELEVQGRVVVSFVVERDGSIGDARVVRSVDPSLDKEALRVVRSMPKWTPGKQGGAAVRVKFNVPVTFRLQ